MKKLMGWIIKEKGEGLPQFIIGAISDYFSDIDDEVFDGVLLFTHRKDAERFSKEGQTIIKAEIHYEPKRQASLAGLEKRESEKQET